MILFYLSLPCLILQAECSWKQAKTFWLGTPSLPSVPLILLFFLDEVFLTKTVKSFSDISDMEASC